MIGQVDLVAQKLQQLDSCDAGIQVIIIGELVAEEVDSTEALTTRGDKWSAAGKPATQRDAVKLRNAALRVKSDKWVGDTAQNGSLKKCVVEPRCKRGEARTVGKMRNHP